MTTKSDYYQWKLRSDAEAAQYLKIDLKVLRALRRTEQIPIWVNAKSGRWWYAVAELDAYRAWVFENRIYKTFTPRYYT
jgi:hypothetical protein